MNERNYLKYNNLQHISLKCTHRLSRFVIISMLQMSKLRLRGERRKDLSLSICLLVSRQILLICSHLIQGFPFLRTLQRGQFVEME